MKSWSAWAVIVEYKDSEDSKDRAIVYLFNCASHRLRSVYR